MECKLRFGNLGSAVEPEMRLETPFTVLPEPGNLIKSERSHARNRYRYDACPTKGGRFFAAHDSFMTEVGVFTSGTFGEMHSYGIDANIYFDLVDRIRPDWVAFWSAPSPASCCRPRSPSRMDSPAARFDDVSTMIKDDVGFYHWGSVARYRNGDAQGAWEAIRHALELEPEHPGLLEWFGQSGMHANVA